MRKSKTKAEAYPEEIPVPPEGWRDGTDNPDPAEAYSASTLGRKRALYCIKGALEKLLEELEDYEERGLLEAIPEGRICDYAFQRIADAFADVGVINLAELRAELRAHGVKPEAA